MSLSPQMHFKLLEIEVASYTSDIMLSEYSVRSSNVTHLKFTLLHYRSQFKTFGGKISFC